MKHKQVGLLYSSCSIRSHNSFFMFAWQFQRCLYMSIMMSTFPHSCFVLGGPTLPAHWPSKVGCRLRPLPASIHLPVDLCQGCLRRLSPYKLHWYFLKRRRGAEAADWAYLGEFDFVPDHSYEWEGHNEEREEGRYGRTKQRGNGCRVLLLCRDTFRLSSKRAQKED